MVGLACLGGVVAFAALVWLVWLVLRTVKELADQAGLADFFERQRDEWHESWSQERKQREEAERKCSELEEKCSELEETAAARWLEAKRYQDLAKKEDDARIAAEEKLHKLEVQWFERDERGRLLEEQVDKLLDAQDDWQKEKEQMLKQRYTAGELSRMWHDRLINSMSIVSQHQRTLDEAVRSATMAAAQASKELQAYREQAGVGSGEGTVQDGN